MGRLGRVTAGGPLLLGARWDELERYGSGGRVQGAWWWCQGWVAEGRKGWLVVYPGVREKEASAGGGWRRGGWTVAGQQVGGLAAIRRAAFAYPGVREKDGESGGCSPAGCGV